jgi:signal transduction histidine kinase
MSGVTMFDPSAIVDSPVAPTVAITDVRVLDDTGERSFPTGDELTLAPATHAVTLEFAALDFTDSARSRYRYQLEGVDPGWIENGPRRSVRYTNLPPGRFVFRVHGTSRDGVWSVAEATQVLVVRPAFWQTLWFRLTVVVGVLAGLAAGYRWRIHRVHELERMRLRIASDLHDEVSSELAAITLLSGMLGKREYLAPDDRDSLDEIGLTSRRINDALRDIVWYVNPEHDTVGSMVARMRRTAGRLLVDIEHTFDADVEDAAARIGMHRRREIVLAYKELVHNAVRHADAGRVEITIRARDARFHMTIRDDGIGFDVDGSSGGTGLPSVRRRAARIGGEIGIASEATIGTVVELTAPLVAP